MNSCLYVDRVSKNEKRKARKYDRNMVSFPAEYIGLLEIKRNETELVEVHIHIDSD